MYKLLVVDDEARIVSFLARGLSARGYAVDSVGDGNRALKLLTSTAYDLVILDLRLPELDGVEVLRRAGEAIGTTPVIVLSALADVEAKVRCLDLGAADYVTKPFSLAELLARIQARLRQSRREESGRYIEVGNVVLDRERRTADLGNGPVTLSAREFLLLQHLMKQRAGICTREELLSEVWGYSFDPGTNVVDVCVGRLRSKLGGRVIETIRNVGYALQGA